MRVLVLIVLTIFILLPGCDSGKVAVSDSDEYAGETIRIEGVDIPVELIQDTAQVYNVSPDEALEIVREGLAESQARENQ